jgi:very-short-patch-repair endonuclease
MKRASSSKPTYAEGLHDGQQMATFITQVKLEKYIREYMCSNMWVVMEDEGER